MEHLDAFPERDQPLADGIELSLRLAQGRTIGYCALCGVRVLSDEPSLDTGDRVYHSACAPGGVDGQAT